MPPPPLPPCSVVLNPAYFTNLIARIEAFQLALNLPDFDVRKSALQAELQALVEEAFGNLSLIESTITSQIAYLNALLVAPTDLPSVITWVTDFIAQLTGPVAKLTAQLAALAVQIAAVTAAINAVASALGISISIPSVGVICEL